MRRSTSVAVVAALTLCLGCARMRAALRYAVAADNSNVLVIETGHPAADCVSLGAISVVDGYPCLGCTNPYEGDPARALRRLKNRVAMRGGNLLLLEGVTDESMISHAPGYSIRMSGVAYRCRRLIAPKNRVAIR